MNTSNQSHNPPPRRPSIPPSPPSPTRGEGALGIGSRLYPGLLRRSLRFSLCAFALGVSLSVTAAEVAWILAAVCLGLLAWRERLRPRWSPLLPPMAVYCAAAVLAAAAAVDPSRSLRPVLADLQKLLLVFLFGWAFAVEGSAGVLPWLGLGFVLSAGLGLFQSLGWSLLSQWGLLHPESPTAMYWYLPYPRAHGSMHPVTYGEHMALAMLAGLSALLLPPRALRLRRRWILSFVALTAAALLLSQTRGAWIAALAGLGALAWATGSKLRRTLVPIALVAGVLLLPVHPLGRGLWARAASAVNPLHEINAGRRELWTTAWAIFRDHPVLGAGPNNFRLLFPIYHPEPIEEQNSWGDAHNQYLHHMAERGLTGLAALLAVLGALIALALRSYRRSPSALTLWAFSGCCALAAMNLTETAFQTARLWMLLLFAFSWAEASGGLAKRKPGE